MITVDGVCENGLMQKAVLRNKTVMTAADEATCNSTQNLALDKAIVKKVVINNDTGYLEDLCSLK